MDRMKRTDPPNQAQYDHERPNASPRAKIMLTRPPAARIVRSDADLAALIDQAKVARELWSPVFFKLRGKPTPAPARVGMAYVRSTAFTCRMNEYRRARRERTFGYDPDNAVWDTWATKPEVEIDVDNPAVRETLYELIRSGVADLTQHEACLILEWAFDSTGRTIPQIHDDVGACSANPFRCRVLALEKILRHVEAIDPALMYELFGDSALPHRFVLFAGKPFPTRNAFAPLRPTPPARDT
jgi:hypothetical protein